MGIYVNPNHESMKLAVNSEIYIDKTGLLKVLNKSIGQEKHFFAVSRARRFGKSMAAGMIDAYYSKGCDSRKLFEPYEIARDPDFEKYLNKFNVLHFDVATYFNSARTEEEMIPDMDAALLGEMKEEFPYLNDMGPKNTPAAMNMVFKKDGIKFIVIIDEYDCIVRDAPDNEELILDYLKYLRGFFKTEESKHFLALGYITGILPIKKVKGESALNNFMEYTMTEPKGFAAYFGFTENEVEGLCSRYGRDIRAFRDWYDGYYMYEPAVVEPGALGSESDNERGCEPLSLEERSILESASHNERVQESFLSDEKNKDGSVSYFNESCYMLRHMYNPNSLVDAFMQKELVSYWKNTGSFESLQQFIVLNYSGLKDDIVAMLAGERRPADISTFQNDLTHFKRKDDVLTCLIHMGYLGYDARTKEAFIPNREVAEVFEAAIKTGDWDDVGDALAKSDGLLKSTWDLDERAVVKAISESHQDYASIINFHDENALALAIMISYYTARREYYVKRELPAGRGYADIVFIPKAAGRRPAMVVELKWNRSARAAIKQIKDKSYTGLLSGYKGEIILVGINYTKKSGKYSCRIEKVSGQT